MTVLVTGSTGFTGSRIVQRLIERGIRPRCMARASSDVRPLFELGVDVVYGDIGDADSLRRAIEGVDVLLNATSLGFGQAPTLVSAAERAGVSRAVFISTTAIFTRLNARSRALRVAAEEAIAQSALRYTIVRPTMIYGNARDRNMVRLVRWLQRWPVIPVAGDGERLQQPIHVDDVAGAVIDAAWKDVAVRRAYNVAGAAPLTFNEIIDTVARSLNRRVFKIHLPIAPMAGLLGALERARIRLPVKSEQILRLNEDKAFPYDEAARDLGFAPRSFAEGIAAEIAALAVTAPRPA
jgi:nucleoside-diphosphate-sugar epimerase